MKFVVAPSPHHIESLMGYILRLTEANGYPTTSYVIHAMTGKWFASKHGRLDAAPLARLAGLTEEQVNRLTLVVTTRSKCIFNIAGCELTSNDMRPGHPRICPKCLEEKGCCDTFWEISHACACPTHGAWLVEVCPGCGKGLAWTRGKLAECRCGYDLTKADLERAPEPVLALMAALRAATFRDPAIAPWPEHMDHLRGMDLGQLCKLIWVMSDELHRLRHGGNVVRNRGKLTGYVPEVAEALTDWPLGFRRFLEKNYSKELDAAECLPKFRRRFSWVLARLAKNTREGYMRFRPLVQEVFTFASRYWTRSHLMPRDGRLDWVVLPEKMRWGSAGECAQIMGLHTATMKRDAVEQQFPYRLAVSANSSRGKTYDLDWARAQAPKSHHRSMGVRQAARLLGVSNGAIEQLRVKGVFGKSRRTSRNGIFSREDIEVMRRRFAAAVATAPKKRHKSFPTVDRLSRVLYLDTKQKASLYEGILDGKIKVQGNAGSSPEQYQIDPSEMPTILGDHLAARGQFISYKEAGERLLCVVPIVQGLVKSKYIKRKRFRGRERLIRESVEAFERKYESVSSVRRRLNLPVNVVSKTIEELEIKKVIVPCLQYSAVILEKEHVSVLEAALRSRP